MKILMITQYVTINTRPEFTKNRTGFGYMVYDIAKSVGTLDDVDVLCSDSRGGGFELEGVHYLERSFGLFLRNMHRCVPLRNLFSMWMRYRMTGGALIRMVYYWLMSGYLVALLEKRNYDIVHIHQGVFDTEFWMAACKKAQVPFVVTLHGLNSFSDTVNLEPAGKQYERDMLARTVKGEIPITVISTGMKKLIESTCQVKNSPYIDVVCNAFSFPNQTSEKLEIRSLYGLPAKSKIILCVGNVCRRKNQIQLVKAFDLMDEETAKDVYILFLGSHLEADYKLDDYIKASGHSSHFISCGNVNKELVSLYYEQGNGVALMSLSEGFGLCLVEGLHFGLPCMSFTDVDAFEDIYDEKVMVGVAEHTDKAVSDGLKRLITNDWDRKAIHEYSRKFEPDVMAREYQKVYCKIVEQ